MIDPTTGEEWEWLASTVRLQREAYGHDPASLTEEQLCDSLKDNIFQAARELFEASVEFKSKYWSVDPPYVNRDRLIQEIVDSLHFIANCLVNVGCDDRELAGWYIAKQLINRERMASGTYSERKGGLGDGSD